jgi:type I restriction enzyme S subunit
MVTGTSSSHQRTRPTDILNIRAVIPPDELSAAFNSLFIKALIQINNLRLESDVLSQMRDSLLPKLMSGQIRVPVEAKV